MDQLTTPLHILIGLPLWDAHCVAHIAWFQFGQCHATLNIDGTMTRKVGDYVLHIQGHWSLTDSRGAMVIDGDPVIVGRYAPQTARDDGAGAFADQDAQRNHDVAAWVATAPVVEQVHVDQLGTVQIQLTGQYRLTLAPETASSGDHWRLGQPLTQLPDIVVYPHRSV